MNELSHWNAATDFTAEQAAALGVGIDPDQPGYVRTKSKHLYGRMKHCYDARKNWLQIPDDATVQWDEIDISNHDQMLDSVEMHRQSMAFDFDDGKRFAEWMEDASKSGFETQRFSRQEFARWLSAVGVDSVYRFGESLPPPLEKQGGHWPWGNHHTKTLGYLEQAAKRWWVHYDPSDVTTAPLNKDVIAWLKKEFSLSEKRASSIASMLRGDDIPTGPHS